MGCASWAQVLRSYGTVEIHLGILECPLVQGEATRCRVKCVLRIETCKITLSQTLAKSSYSIIYSSIVKPPNALTPAPLHREAHLLLFNSPSLPISLLFSPLAFFVALFCLFFILGRIILSGYV